MPLTLAEQYDLVTLLRHVVRECETRDPESYAIPIPLASVREMLAKLD
jgi:hypothetical protein